MAVTSTYAYALPRYANGRYAGDHPASLTPSQQVLGVPFLGANDRYQVVVCSDSGTSSSAPEFRYWYASTPTWEESLAGDLYFPIGYTVDEDGTPVMGSLETPFREFAMRRSAQVVEATVDGILVEFIPQPAAVDTAVLSTTNVGFSIRVEADGLVDYTRTVTSRTTGVWASATLTFAEELGDQAGTPWPNMRAEYFPIRSQKCRSARVILTNVSLCEIVRIQLLGKLLPARQT